MMVSVHNVKSAIQVACHVIVNHSLLVWPAINHNFEIILMGNANVFRVRI
jgi:hypothetical protein